MLAKGVFLTLFFFLVSCSTLNDETTLNLSVQVATMKYIEAGHQKDWSARARDVVWAIERMELIASDELVTLKDFEREIKRIVNFDSLKPSDKILAGMIIQAQIDRFKEDIQAGRLESDLIVKVKSILKYSKEAAMYYVS